MVSEKILAGKKLFNRSIASSASCGICGKTVIGELIKTTPPLNNNSCLNRGTLKDYFTRMRPHQHTFGLTGGSHAAAIFASDEMLLAENEDIGRHNAVEKVLQAMLSKTVQNKLLY